jgi:hypothetical protein
MRSSRLISDDDFIVQRDILKRQLAETSAAPAHAPTENLSDCDVSELMSALTNLESTRRIVPLNARRAFTEAIVPSGYVLDGVRTASKGLLINTFGPNDDPSSHIVPQTVESLNAIFAEIRRFLAILRFGKEPKKKAA